MSPARPSRAEQIALVVMVCAAVAAFGSAYGQPAAWVFWLPCVLSAFWQIGRVPRVVQQGARYAAGAFLGLATLLGLMFTTYPVLSHQTATSLTYLAGYGLAFFSALFLLGTAVWPPAATLFPAATGLLVAACFNPFAKITPLLLTPGAAAFVFLWLTVRAGAPGKDLWRDLQWNLRRLAASALGTALVAGAIILGLPPLQARVEQAILFWSSLQTTEYSSLSMKSQLGDLQELKLSPQVVMRVWSSRPQKLRGRVFPWFDGQAWHGHALPGTPLPAAPAKLVASAGLTEWLETVPGNLFLMPGADPSTIAASDAVRTRIVQSAFNPGVLVAPGNTALVRAPLSSLRIDPYESLMPPLSAPVQIYAVLNRVRGNGRPGQLPPEMEAEFLSLPIDTDPRWKELAARLADDTRSPEEGMAKTVSYVKNAARYSLRTGSFGSRQPVTEFFFEKKAGYCQYFASAAVILLRLQGVPSRYVTGFNVQEWNRLGGYFVVREADAHAWVEAYLPGKGWVEADPTPEAEFEARREAMRSGWLAEAREWFAAQLAEIRVRMGAGDWRALGRWAWDKVKTVLHSIFYERVWVTALVALLASILLLAKRKRKTRRGRRAARLPRGEFSKVPSELTELMGELDGLWERRGFARRASRAPLEHLASIPQDSISPALREASRKAVECFYQASFGGIPIAPDQVQELRRAVRSAGAAP